MSLRRRIPAAVRRQVAEYAGHRCSYCRSPEVVGIPMVVDHIIPLAAGGTSDIGNLCLACYRCNEFKGARQDAPDPLTGEMVALFNPRTQAGLITLPGARMLSVLSGALPVAEPR